MVFLPINYQYCKDSIQRGRDKEFLMNKILRCFYKFQSVVVNSTANIVSKTTLFMGSRFGMKSYYIAMPKSKTPVTMPSIIFA